MPVVVTPPVAGDLLQVVYRAYSGGQMGEIGCHYYVDSVVGGGLSIQDIADAIGVIAEAQWPAILTPVAHTLGVQVRLYSRTLGVVTQSAQAADLRTPGVVVSDQVPGEMGAIVRKRTGVAGPAYRGRVYVPFVPATFLSPGGDLTVVGRTTYLTFANALFTTLTLTSGGNTTVLKPTIAHRVSVAFPLPLTDQPVTSLDVPGTLGSQRSRGDYGTPNPDY